MFTCFYFNVFYYSILFTGVEFNEFKRHGKHDKPLKKAHTISLRLDHGLRLTEEWPVRLANTQTKGGIFWSTIIVWPKLNYRYLHLIASLSA